MSAISTGLVIRFSNSLSVVQLVVIALVAMLSSCHTTKKASTDCIHAAQQRISNATYATKIDFYNKHFSGLLLFKAISDTNERVVFVTETGFKLFDFGFTPAGFTVQYCLPPLRKKIILNTFKNDLGQLVLKNTSLPAYINQKDSAITLTFARGNNHFEDFVVDSKCQQLLGINRGGRFVKAVSTKIAGTSKGNFDIIDIYHHPLKLHISLKQIER